MSVDALQTSVFKKGDSLFEFLTHHLKFKNLENSVLVITSKIISIAENEFVSANTISKGDLVRREADLYLGEIGYDVHLTVKHGLLIPSAGIDESNSEDQDFILYPKNPFKSCEKIYNFLKEHFKLKNFGVILSDSHTTPLRKGVTGISLAHWGFRAVENKVGDKDLFDRALKYTSSNWADALAAASVILMGEANESCPLAVIQCPKIQFTDSTNPQEVSIPLKEDLYYPLLKNYQPKNSSIK